MNNDFKSHYIMGFKDGLTFGIEKGMELAEAFEGEDCSECPPNTSPMLVESVPSVSEE